MTVIDRRVFGSRGEAGASDCEGQKERRPLVAGVGLEMGSPAGLADGYVSRTKRNAPFGASGRRCYLRRGAPILRITQCDVKYLTRDCS